ncbi:MAG TPA: hypothetical protein VFV87_09825, partial [Pirellulaceae bacterium]|nr:hypothetical protein [Pirellulaceae bacterium]
MDTVNPYAVTPGEPAPPAIVPVAGLTVRQGIITVIGTAAAFAAIGALLGTLLGLFVPSYYRTVFDAENTPGFEPAQVG